MKKNEKRIINEDIETIKYLIKTNRVLGKYDKVSELEKELKRLNDLKKEGK